MQLIYYAAPADWAKKYWSWQSEILWSLRFHFTRVRLWTFLPIFVYVYVNKNPCTSTQTDTQKHAHTHIHTHIYIYIYIYVCGWLYIYIYIRSISSLLNISLNIIDIFVYIFFINLFELPYWSYGIRLELVDTSSIISNCPSTFCPTLGHHQRRMYYKSDVTFVCTLLLCKKKSVCTVVWCSVLLFEFVSINSVSS